MHLFTPLPFRPGKGGFGELFRTHLFVNAGNVGTYDGKHFLFHSPVNLFIEYNFPDPENPLLDQLKNNIRVAFGVGVALRLGSMARVEVNYCFPYLYDRADRVQPGIQFGIGMQFL